jgi:hypothetical protein
MPPERSFLVPAPSRSALACLGVAIALVTAGCASPPAPPPEPVVVEAAPAPVPDPDPDPSPQPARQVDSHPAAPAMQALVHADRVRGLPEPELTQEVARLSAAPQTPLVQVELALTLMQSRAALNAIRANQLLQRVLAQDATDARPLHPLCRHLLAQLADQKRLEDQAERQAQQLRDAQRRADQLAERLDAIRAIERARPRLQ